MATVASIAFDSLLIANGEERVPVLCAKQRYLEASCRSVK